MAVFTNLDKIYMFYILVLTSIWLVLLLWGIIKDPSRRSRLLRLLGIFIIIGMSNNNISNNVFYDTDTWWVFLHNGTKGFPLWFIILLSGLLLLIIYGYIKIYKESKASY